MATQQERNAVAAWTRGYEEGFHEAFDSGFDAGVRAAKQKFLTFFEEEAELPDSVTAWLRS